MSHSITSLQTLSEMHSRSSAAEIFIVLEVSGVFSVESEVRSTPMPIAVDNEESLGSQIKTLQGECGCALGARFLIVAILLYLAVWYFLLRPMNPSIWLAIAIGVPALILSVGVGKFTGILMARFRARRLKARLEAQQECSHDA
jgi:hypothetical protein